MKHTAQRDDEVLRECQAFRERLQGGQLERLFDHFPGVYFVTKSSDGRVMMANDVAVRLCGFEHESEMLGKTDYDIFSPERADAYVRDDRHVFKTGESVIDRVEMAPDPSNAINWFITTKIPLRSADGEIIGLACMARNMTEAFETLRPYTEMNEVLEYVREHYARPIKLEELARMAHLSLRQFERRFRAVFQITPMKHIRNVRVRAACNRLASTNDTVAAIALEVGFYDHSHFTRSFKRVMGLSPSEYRKRGHKSPW